MWVSYQQLAKRGRDISSSAQNKSNQLFRVDEGLVHIVSMGHRLQTISFSEENSTVGLSESKGVPELSSVAGC